MDLASKRWQSEYLFIIGKGVDHVLVRRQYENWKQFDFVPPYGQPHSDYLFVMDKSSGVPRMAVGRIAAKNAADVQLYLDKVIEFDATANLPQTIEDKAWTKRVIHVGGGDSNIQDFIATGLNNLRDILEASNHGAKVTSFFKNSTDVIQSAQTEEVKKKINDGSGLFSFFGHSAPNTLDFDVGAPNEYQNKGKYPLFFAIGCNTNRMFEKATTLSEDFVLIKDKGAIGFFGTTWLTTLGNVNNYARIWYENFGGVNYGQPIGKIVQETIREYSNQTSFFAEQIKNTYVLHGDPALEIYPSEAPDYLVNVEKTTTTPTVVDLQADSFQLNLTINNIGKALEDSLLIKIELEDANGNGRELLNIKLDAPLFEKEYLLTLPINDKNILGKNILHLSVNDDRAIVEAPHTAQTNNKSEISFVAIANDIKPIWPKDFSIVNSPNITLLASTTNAFSIDNSYMIELDTTELFDSPLKLSNTLKSKGGVIDWHIPIELTNNKVYYWRVGLKREDTIEPNKWNSSSFTKRTESSLGWNQGHRDQFKKSMVNFLITENTTLFNYNKTSKNIKITNGTFPNLLWIEMALFEDGFRQSSAFPCPNSNEDMFERFIVFVYDPLTLEREYNPPNPNNSAPNCFGTPQFFYMSFLNNASERKKLIDLINNTSSGKYIALFSAQRNSKSLSVEEWETDSLLFGTNIFRVFESQGC